MRLEDKTPAKISLEEFIKWEKQAVGRPKTIWLSNIKVDLKSIINFKNLGEAFQEIGDLCQNRVVWRDIVERLVSQTATDSPSRRILIKVRYSYRVLQEIHSQIIMIYFDTFIVLK